MIFKGIVVLQCVLQDVLDLADLAFLFFDWNELMILHFLSCRHLT